LNRYLDCHRRSHGLTFPEPIAVSVQTDHPIEKKRNVMSLTSTEKRAFKYCAQGNDVALLDSVPQKVNINHQIPTTEYNHIVLESPSFMHVAVVHKRPAIAQVLIDLGIDMNLRDSVCPVFSKSVLHSRRHFSSHRTAVCLSCVFGSVAVLRILLDAGADPFIEDNVLLFQRNQQECVDLLIDAGVSVRSHNFAVRFSHKKFHFF
jgi:hypothetical protein